ncbi:hypothetical protein [Kitasatospora sp. KL5]|uniref:hypothetical protein n=1 Tax=Kitasatospora sp. KL5 TaxID=3425125 RepID=UPI003D6EC50B
MSITVCLPAQEAGRVEAAVAEAMAPFERDYERGDDLDIWDSWRITGGTVHGGGFPVLRGHERDSRLLHEFPSRWLTGHVPVANDFGWCAGGPRELLDLSASREVARELADAAWQRWHDLAAELPPARPWRLYLDRHSADPRAYPSRRASEDYDGQPLLQAYRSYLRTLPTECYRWDFLRPMDPVARIGGMPRQEFVEWQTAYALPTRNLLTPAGWWYEDGGAGVHGTCDDPSDCRHEPDVPAGYDHIDAYLAALPGDMLVVNVHCHV